MVALSQVDNPMGLGLIPSVWILDRHSIKSVIETVVRESVLYLDKGIILGHSQEAYSIDSACLVAGPFSTKRAKMSIIPRPSSELLSLS